MTDLQQKIEEARKKAEQKQQAAAAAMENLKKLEARQKANERKAREHQFIQFGSAIEFVIGAPLSSEKKEEISVEEKKSLDLSENENNLENKNQNNEDELLKNESEEKSEYPEEDEEAFERSENERIIAGFSLEKETALVETVLFLESEPQNAEKLSIITKLSVEVVNETILKLKEKYADADSGIELAEITGGWQLVPKKEMFNLVRERYGKKNGGMLSKAALETLSIIAYSQPITRAEIESLRHVSADNMMRILFDRKFIKEVGKKDVPGKPTLYGTTKEFLEFFHLQNISELPQLDEMDSERFVLAR